MTGVQWVNIAVSLVGSIVGGTGIWGFLQHLSKRKERKAEAARIVADTELAQQQASTEELTRKQLLSEVQERAQRVALESAHIAFEQVSAERKEDRAKIDVLTAVVEQLIDAVEAIEPLLPRDAVETVALRRAVWTARKAV